MTLGRALDLPDQPGRAQERVSGDDTDAGQQAERGQPVEPSPGIGPAPGLDAFDDGDPLKDRAQDHALRHSGDDRADGERDVPERPVAWIAPPELERDAAKHEAQQHRDHQRICGGQYDAVGERKGREESAAAQHQPCLIAVPNRSGRIHGLIPFLADGEEGKQDADPEVEAVHDDIGEDGEGDDEGPDDRQIECIGHGLLRRSGCAIKRGCGCDASGPNRRLWRFGLMGLGCVAHQLQQIPGASAEHEKVDDHEGDQRSRNGRGRERGVGLPRQQLAIDGIRLPPHLGRDPSRDDRHKTGRPHQDGEPVQQRPVV
eukprot:Opistho-2@94286